MGFYDRYKNYEDYRNDKWGEKAVKDPLEGIPENEKDDFAEAFGLKRGRCIKCGEEILSEEDDICGKCAN